MRQESEEPLDQARFREVLGHFASGLVVVTAQVDRQPVGFTCQSFASLSLDPPLVVFAPARTSMSWPKIRTVGACCVNVLEGSQEHLARAFARSGDDKFAGVRWEPSSLGAPRLEGALAWLDCEVEALYEGGDHELVVARVRDLGIASGAPLIFYRGGFGGLSF